VVAALCGQSQRQHADDDPRRCLFLALHYFKAIEELGSTDSEAVVAKMKELPTSDPLFGEGEVRADGRKIHKMYLFEVKSPAESSGPWDYYKLVNEIPADVAFRPIEEGGCELVQ
jgi:branched-chain amino acid transport system substrate-binding protein